jgi:hypothetical protein
MAGIGKYSKFIKIEIKSRFHIELIEYTLKFKGV